jgi:hypothetical protein
MKKDHGNTAQRNTDGAVTASAAAALPAAAAQNARRRVGGAPFSERASKHENERRSIVREAARSSQTVIIDPFK